MNVVVVDCNYRQDVPHPVFVEMGKRLGAHGIHLTVDDHWSDDYALADLVIGADPVADREALTNVRIFGQRTLNRCQRMEIAAAAGAPVARYGSPVDDGQLTAMSQAWGDCAVLKYDWSSRRNGVFLWPLGAGRKPFPADFRAGCDLFMEFLDADPATYKVDVFGGTFLAGWVLPTRDMRNSDWQVVEAFKPQDFAPPPELSDALQRASAAMLRHGVGYASFDLMRAGDGFRVIEVNSCSVATSAWNYWPERYAARYAEAVRQVLQRLDSVPRFAALRESARREGNDQSAPQLKERPLSPRTGTADAPPPPELVIYRRLRAVERLPLEQVIQEQRKILEMLLRHAARTVPFYRDRLRAVLGDDDRIDWDRWSELPKTSRDDIRRHRHELLSRELPPFHGAIGHGKTAGAAGEPVSVSWARMQIAVQNCTRLRLYDWHGIGPGEAMATLLPGVPPDDSGRKTWALGWQPAPHGAHYSGDAGASPADQLRWLARLGAVYLRTSPSRARLLALAAAADPALRAGIKGIVTQGEIVTEDTRRLCRTYLGHGPTDAYGLTETGFVALQCPASDRYHAQSDVCVVEVVNERGEACAAGETGEIVVTPIYGFAMPLIRYATGDYAEMPSDAGRCGCGLALPVIGRVLGRRRNLLRLPGEPPRQPDVDSKLLWETIGASAWQLAQIGPLGFELRYESHRSEGEADFDGAARHLGAVIRPDVEVRFRRLAALPQLPDGRRESFICELPEAQ